MTAAFRTSFLRDVRKLRDAEVRARVRNAIEAVEAAGNLRDVPDLKKLSGASGFYRMRVGDYRIGVAVEGETVEFVRMLHRRDIYRAFP